MRTSSRILVLEVFVAAITMFVSPTVLVSVSCRICPSQLEFPRLHPFVKCLVLSAFHFPRARGSRLVHGERAKRSSAGHVPPSRCDGHHGQRDGTR